MPVANELSSQEQDQVEGNTIAMTSNINHEPSSSQKSTNSPSNKKSAPENCTVYRKNDEDDFLFAGVTKKSGGKSKGAKKQKVQGVPFEKSQMKWL